MREKNMTTSKTRYTIRVVSAVILLVLLCTQLTRWAGHGSGLEQDLTGLSLAVVLFFLLDLKNRLR